MSCEDFDAAIPVLKEKVLMLAANDDRYGLRLAVTAIEGGAVRLGDLVTTLDADFKEDREKIAAVQKTSAALRKVDELVRAELKRVEDLKAEKKPDDKPPEEKKK